MRYNIEQYRTISIPQQIQHNTETMRGITVKLLQYKPNNSEKHSEIRTDVKYSEGFENTDQTGFSIIECEKK